jgi:hypothetical protein
MTDILKLGVIGVAGGSSKLKDKTDRLLNVGECSNSATSIDID